MNETRYLQVTIFQAGRIICQSGGENIVRVTGLGYLIQPVIPGSDTPNGPRHYIKGENLAMVAVEME